MRPRMYRESLPQPPDPGVHVWRYLDLARLAWILDKKHLPLTRVDLLQDPFEGSVPVKERAALEGMLAGFAVPPDISEQMLSDYRRFNLNLRRATYASYWHLDDDESEAMWKLYCGERFGLALQSTYAKLDESLVDRDTAIGLVQYIDYGRDPFPGSDLLVRLLLKRRAFKHESEVRILLFRLAALTAVKDGIALPECESVPWDFDSTVESIHVHPAAPAWYFEACRATLRAFDANLVAKLKWSALRCEPTF
jgi:hypothetical protein